MIERTIQITESDMAKLKGLIEARANAGTRDQENLEMLAEELERAEIVQPHEIASDAVTMHSHVLVRDLDSRVESTYMLVFPPDADIAQGKISILAPIATALLGYREGDVIEWPTPGGWRRLEVAKVLYQPEAAGDEPSHSVTGYRQAQEAQKRFRSSQFASL